MDHTAEDLRAARDLILMNGLARNTFHDEYDRYCALGAIRAVVPGVELHVSNSEGGARFRRARAFIYKANGGQTVSRWNDDPYTTEEDVLEVFSQAIKLAEDNPSMVE